MLRPGTTFDEQAIIGHARTLLAPYKCPKQVFAVDTLPRNHLGKVLKTDLRTAYGQPTPAGQQA